MNQYTTFADKFPLPAPSFQEAEAGLSAAEEAAHGAILVSPGVAPLPCSIPD
jgi:hypothetical protein